MTNTQLPTISSDALARSRGGLSSSATNLLLMNQLTSSLQSLRPNNGLDPSTLLFAMMAARGAW